MSRFKSFLAAVTALREAPFHINREQPLEWEQDSFLSASALERKWKRLGTVQIDGELISFWIQNSLATACVTDRQPDSTGAETNRILTELVFQHHPSIPVNKPLQVDRVASHPDRQNKQYASTLYKLLAASGFSVISDYTQYDGGKMLWKKLAHESDSAGYIVKIWDLATKSWVKDSEQKVVAYNASNLDDSIIWKDISRRDERTTLLVLQNK